MCSCLRCALMYMQSRSGRRLASIVIDLTRSLRPESNFRPSCQYLCNQKLSFYSADNVRLEAVVIRSGQVTHDGYEAAVQDVLTHYHAAR